MMACDNCGDLYPEKELHHHSVLLRHISSALKGGLGSLCKECHRAFYRREYE
jgi:hypothetical protein